MPGAVRIRPLTPADAPAARALARAALGFTPYSEPPLAALITAIEQDSAEARAAVAEVGGEVVGVVSYGLVAGAEGAGKLHLIAVTAAARLQGVATALVNLAADDVMHHRGRLIIAEIADDPIIRPAQTLLERCGFHEEARVADYYRDGTDLAIWRRDLPA